MNHYKIIEAARAAFDVDEACVLCTVVRLDGSGYGRPGARLLLTESGQREGYISGGCLEKDLCRRVWSATKHGARLIAFDTRGNAVQPSRYNTGCEGVVYILCQRIDRSSSSMIDVLALPDESGTEQRLLTIYRSESKQYQIGDAWSQPTASDVPAAVLDRFEKAKRNTSIQFVDADDHHVEAAIEILPPRRRLVIFGAGDDVIPVVQSAGMQGWKTTVIGHRPELADPSRFPGSEVLCGPLHVVANALTGLEHSDVVIMTHDFDRDVELLPVLLDRRSRSIGLLGPKRRLGNLVKALYERGRILSEPEIEVIRSPIGLDIGAVTPEEIATSIVAELIAMPRGRFGGSLHDRRAPINEPTTHVVEPTRDSLARISVAHSL